MSDPCAGCCRGDPAPSPAQTVSPRAWLPGFFALAVIWGASFLFIKVGVSELHPLYVTLGRVLTGMVTLLVVLAVTRDRLPRDLRLWGHMSLVGVIGTALPFTLFAYGEQRVSSTLAGIWNATTPLVVLPLAVWIFRTERMTWRRAVGLGMGFVGVLVILGVWQRRRRLGAHRPAHVPRRGGLLRLRHPLLQALRRRPAPSRAWRSRPCS